MSSIAPRSESAGVLCALEQAIGRAAQCTRERCAFWEPGGAVVPAGCVFDRVPLAFDRRPETVELLLELKAKDAPGARSRLYALLSEALDDD